MSLICATALCEPLRIFIHSLEASRVGFSQAQRFLTGAVIPRAHGPTPAPAPAPPSLHFWRRRRGAQSTAACMAVGSLARVGALFSREFRALGGKIAFLCTGAKYSGIFDPIEVLGALLGVCWGGLQRLSGAWYCCWGHSKLICGGGGEVIAHTARFQPIAASCCY